MKISLSALFLSAVVFCGSILASTKEAATYDLFIDKKRSEAIDKLIKSWDKKQEAQSREMLSRFLETFYFEKAQQAYESGLSLVDQDPQLSQNQFRESLQEEPNHFLPEVAISRMELRNGNCDKAQMGMEKFFFLKNFSDQIQLFDLQLQLCRGQFENFRKSNAFLSFDSQFSIYFLNAEARYLFKSGQFQKWNEHLAKMKKADPLFPETFYWEGLSEARQVNDRKAALQKYIQVCKNLTPRQKRNYFLEVDLCRQVSEAESKLKKMKAD